MFTKKYLWIMWGSTFFLKEGKNTNSHQQLAYNILEK